MLKGIDVNEKIPYVLKSEEGKADATVFMIGNLSQDEGLTLFTDCMENGQPNMNKILGSKEKLQGICRAGVKAVQNYSGNVAEVPLSDEIFKTIKAGWVIELVTAVMKFNFPSGEEIKK